MNVNETRLLKEKRRRIMAAATYKVVASILFSVSVDGSELLTPLQREQLKQFIQKQNILSLQNYLRNVKENKGYIERVLRSVITEEALGTSNRIGDALQRILLESFNKQENRRVYLRERARGVSEGIAENESVKIIEQSNFINAYASMDDDRIGEEQLSVVLVSGRQIRSNVVKIWNSVLRANTRPDHAASHRQRETMFGTFFVGGEALRFPGDPLGTPGNTYNCQCYLTYEER